MLQHEIYERGIYTNTDTHKRVSVNDFKVLDVKSVNPISKLKRFTKMSVMRSWFQ